LLLKGGNLRGWNTLRAQFRSACDVSDFIGHTLDSGLNPSVFALNAAKRGLHPTQIKHASTLSLRDNSPRIFQVTFGGLLFRHICVTACLSTDRDICTSGSPLSPFSRVSSYRCTSTSNLDFTIHFYICHHGFWRFCTKIRVCCSIQILIYEQINFIMTSSTFFSCENLLLNYRKLIIGVIHVSKTNILLNDFPIIH